MDINDMKIGEFKELSRLLCGTGSTQSVTDNDPFIGQYVIVRTYSAGNFAGILHARYGNKIVLKNSRRLWRWFAIGGISLSEVSQNGIDPQKSKICTVEPFKMVEDIEVIPASLSAQQSIEGAPNYVPE